MEQVQGKAVARNIMWNTVGSLFYLACQWLLSVVVVRFSTGYEDAGVLSLAMSITNIFAIVALFNVRNYQVADSKSIYSTTDYVTHRLLTCALAFVTCAIFVFISGYDTPTTLSVLAYMIIKLVEGFADVLHGSAQKRWRLDIAGKSFIIRGVLLITTFTLSFILWQNLALSIFIMAISTLIPLVFYDYIAVKRLDSFSISFNKGGLLSLSRICLPMVGYGLCIHSITPIARYAIELFHGKEVLGYYATVSTVAVLVQAFVNLIFTPLIGIFEEAYEKNDKKAILKLFVKLIVLLVGVTLLAVVAIAIAGEFAMVLVFGESIRPYVYLLYPTVVASCLTAFVWLMGMLLVVMRDSITLLIGALCGFILNIVLCVATIKETVYWGANLAVIASLALSSAIYLVRFLVFLFSKKTPIDSTTID